MRSLVQRAPLLLLLLLPTGRSAAPATGKTLGIDVSAAFDDAAAWSCAKKTSPGPNRTWAIVRAWHSYAAFDNEAPATLAAAKAAGLEHIDVYMFPCVSKPASTQVDDMISGLANSRFEAVWIDIETNPSTGCAWSNDFAGNCAFVGNLVSELTAKRIAVGIYSSHYEWGAVMGSACDGKFKNLPLWFARYSGGPSCDDYAQEPFGGWTQPYAKQYSDKVDAQTASCGIQGDVDVLC